MLIIGPGRAHRAKDMGVERKWFRVNDNTEIVIRSFVLHFNPEYLQNFDFIFSKHQLPIINSLQFIISLESESNFSFD